MMCEHCPRCMEISPCMDAVAYGQDDSGRYDVCTNVFERPMICHHCFPDVEM